MDIGLKYLPHDANRWTVTRAIAEVLHSEDFAPIIPGRLINFQVRLKPNPSGGARNDSTGLLTLPSDTVGRNFLRRIGDEPIKIMGKKIKCFAQKSPPPPDLTLTLRKTRYVDPNVEEERMLKVQQLDVKFRIDTVQFGVIYYPEHPSNRDDKGKRVNRPISRAFSVEWEKDYMKQSYGALEFQYDHKLIRITLGSEVTEAEGRSIIINFSSIQKVGVGYDGKPYVCFDTLTPPVMEKIDFHRPMTGRSFVDNKKYKQRVGSIHEGHATVAAFSRHIRLVLYNDPDPAVDIVKEFMNKCVTAGLSQSMIIHLGGAVQIEAIKNGFFTPKRIFDLEKTLSHFEWPVAFQLESLLHNGLLHTGDLDQLIPQVRKLLEKHHRQGATFVGDLLRRYNEALQVRPYHESPRECFERVRDKFDFTIPREAFRCYHITFTPTRMILEGPYAVQSNRVIRQYQGYQDHFIRVDFRDEDRLQFRWDREVDGVPFLNERVGTILMNGFHLAGRRFEFLAYSSSALREHAVWFMNPFNHPDRGFVNAKYIRDSLGDFTGTKLLKQPSKYAARLAQAFTATDPSIDILKEEWEEVPDLGEGQFLHTDGVGTISRALGDRIWIKLCETKRNAANLLKPSAYQIRFLGYKGVVAVDDELDKQPGNIHMRLRPSMRKFEVKDNEVAPIEIAQAFELPNTCYLNRPLVMVLEDLGVRKESFQDLQDKAVADAKTIDDSISQFCDVITSHHLGSAFRMREILTRLREKYNMDLTSNGRTISVDNPFLQQLRRVAMTDVLRDIKHSARIPVPNSYLLVGVADEGPAYEAAGYKNVFCLQSGQIYACIQHRGKEPFWIEGNVSISRSPVVHPGDVQRVRAVGKPPEGMMCLFRHLRNVVVMPSEGDRSLASCLGGGDVDGDLFSVICDDSILPRTTELPAEYNPMPPYLLDRDCTVEDICNFIVEYIHSDVLGLLSDRLIIIADQSNEGMRDKNCLTLAELCSWAVDYPKQGTPINLDGDQLPRTLIRCKPDWHAAEVVSPRGTDYYESHRALGHLFRSIAVEDTEPIVDCLEKTPHQPLADPISSVLLEEVRRHLGDSIYVDETPSIELSKLFRRYADELRYICATHTLSNTPGVRLLEAEIVIGTILAKCSQKRWRKDRIYRMRLHAETLVRDVQRNLLEHVEKASYTELINSLKSAWSAWDLSLRRSNEFGANSFGLVSLGIIFDCLDALEKLGAN